MYAPEDKDQALVKTPYGKGLVVRTRTNVPHGRTIMREIELLDWTQGDNSRGPKRPCLLYSPCRFPSMEPLVGSEVSTVYGRGTVTEIRPNEQMAVIKLASWRLARRSTVTCYLSTKSIQVLRPKKLFEKNVFEKVEHAQHLKEQASQLFSAKQYTEALNLYAEAVDAVRYVQHQKDSNNELRADLLVVMITCCNNAATCCLHLHEWERAHKFGKNALILLEALYEKKGKSNILKLLHQEGTSDSKLFGAWMAKSHLVIARGLAERHDTQEAIDNLKKAQEIITEFKKDGDPMLRQLQSQEKEVRKLFASCKDRLKAERKKEKLRAKAMFSCSEEKKESENKEPLETSPLAESKESIIPNVLASLAASVSNNASPELGPAAESSSMSKALTKKRVSFADGTIPGNADEGAEPSFVEEHREALLLVGGIVLGSLCMNFLLRKRQ